ncbi:PilZ domain-containing protein [Nitrosomonas aestuarii]|uniref:PilZ domain-containing protein n=1 Tax=Nitrosomonas aestuarii TaxID=52441 RepID=UPI000D2F9187|nr:PilZ domain-containing protein [Nitrosomonas aestuarii]PTN11531.1 PilZ domain-containing protein [Nitrosomonas aestuarii]
MEERRNLYRTLCAQPDAPLAVIKVNHRVLMQKLKLHPDQSLADLQANVLNTAYAVLQDPLSRADYDRGLQKRYPIRKLSLGPFAAGTVKSFPDRSGKTAKKNRRNYYRILQVQPDAPVAIIIASYHALTKYPYQDLELLDEAYSVLVNPVVRSRYDTLLTGSLLSSTKNLLPVNEHANDFKPVVSDKVVLYSELNATTDKHYCIFCHTLYTEQLSPYQNDICLECASPLPVANNEPVEQAHRAIMRVSVQGEFRFYLFWPDVPYDGIFQDLSPMGMRFLTDVSLNVDDVLKIDAPNFQAVVEVVHKQSDEAYISVGVRFLTIKFEQERGNFLTVSA